MNYIQIDMDAKGLSQLRPIGVLGYDTIRGNAAYRWEYDAQWLHDYRHVRLSGDLQNAGGSQFVWFSAGHHAGQMGQEAN